MLSATDFRTLTTALLPTIADQYASTVDEATRQKVYRGLSLATHARVQETAPKVWDVEGSQGARYRVVQGQCPCPSAQHDGPLCKHRWAVALTKKAQDLATALCQRARYARLHEASGIAWPLDAETLMFCDLDTGKTTMLDPQSAWGSTAEFFVLAPVAEA